MLDATRCSAFMRGGPVIKKMLQTVDAIYVNAVVLGELRAGFLRGRLRQKNEARLSQFLASSRVSAAPVDQYTAERYAVILNALWNAGTPIPTSDMWIAASAMQYGLAVITTDAHFLRIPQILVWHSPPARSS